MYYKRIVIDNMVWLMRCQYDYIVDVGNKN